MLKKNLPRLKVQEELLGDQCLITKVELKTNGQDDKQLLVELPRWKLGMMLSEELKTGELQEKLVH